MSRIAFDPLGFVSHLGDQNDIYGLHTNTINILSQFSVPHFVAKQALPRICLLQAGESVSILFDELSAS